MDNSRKLLNNHLNKNSRYFVLPNEEERIVKYIGAKIIPNRFDNGLTNCVRYHFELEGGTQQDWDRGSRNLLEQMSRIPEGATIGITKSGAGNKTKYLVRLIDTI